MYNLPLAIVHPQPTCNKIKRTKKSFYRNPLLDGKYSIEYLSNLTALAVYASAGRGEVALAIHSELTISSNFWHYALV